MVVDEKHQPMVRIWRENFNIWGIFGLERKSNILSHQPDLGIIAPSYSHQLLQKKPAAACLLGLNLGIPLRTSGEFQGELHIGGFKRSVFAPNNIRWIKADKIQLGDESFFGHKLKFSYKGAISEVLSSECTSVMDTGSSFSYIPEDVLEGYLDTVDKGGNMFIYDDLLKGYYISGDDFKKLKDITLKFDGANIVVPKKEMVIPHEVYKKQERHAKDGLYLSLRALPQSAVPGSNPICILGNWWSELHTYLGDGLPEEYGGKGRALQEVGVTPDYTGARKMAGGQEVDGGAAAKEIAV